MKLTQEENFRIKVLEEQIQDGDLEAMFDYAQLYINRFPEEVTDEIAQKIVNYYEICMNVGNLTAALNLGAMYYSGEFIPRDFKKAKELYEQATKSDDYETQVRAWCNLGYCYYYGRDMEVDDEKAFNCYMRAALLRDANALYKVGDMYRFGRFVKKDEEMAVAFYRQAWEEVSDGTPPYADVCKRIGECALYGTGTEPDAFLALRMLARAEAATYEKIRERDPFAAGLLPKIQEMIGEAKAKVNEQLGL